MVQKELREFYRTMNQSVATREDLKALTERIMPLCGFYKGCIYAHDPYRQVLIPRLSIGISSLSEYDTIDISPIARGVDPVAVAFHSHTPIVTEQFWGNTQCLAFSSVYGTIQRAGVLYLESSSEMIKDPASDPHTIFKALNQALRDCLKIR